MVDDEALIGRGSVEERVEFVESGESVCNIERLDGLGGRCVVAEVVADGERAIGEGPPLLESCRLAGRRRLMSVMAGTSSVRMTLACAESDTELPSLSKKSTVTVSM